MHKANSKEYKKEAGSSSNLDARNILTEEIGETG